MKPDAKPSWAKEAHAYQRRAKKFLVDNAAAGLFLDPGLGKTSISLAAFLELRRLKQVETALVVAPRTAAYEVWDGGNPASEIRAWRDFDEVRTTLLHGAHKDEALRANADAYVINPEGLEWLFDRLLTVGRKALAPERGDRWPFDVLFLDESTTFKHTNTARFKLLKPFLKYFSRKYILTGEPAPNGLLDLFGQIYILDEGAALGRYITQYRNEFFLPTGYGGYTWVPQEGAEEKIYERIAPLVLRMSEADYLDLPPLIGVEPPHLVKVTLPPKARKVYDDLEAHLIADVLGDVVTAANAAVASMKCRQVAAGGLYVDAPERRRPRGPEAWTKLHDAKTDAIEELVEELSGKPALVAVDFHHDAERLRARFGRSVPYVGAGIDPLELRRVAAAWNAGDLRLVLANPATAARSLNLQAGPGTDVVFHSLPWNYEHYDQFIRRVWRQGQRRRVKVHHVVARDTVDEAQVLALGRKARTQRALFDALRSYAYSRPGAAGRGRRRIVSRRR